MRIWYQLVASTDKYKNFIATTQRLCTQAASPGVEIEVHGTQLGGQGTQYRSLWNFEMREILDNGIRAGRSGKYDAFVIANGVDSALIELRELLDIPVLSFMETSSLVACSMGESFSVILPNDKLIPRFHEMCMQYGVERRLTSIETLDMEGLQSYDRAFVDTGFGDECLERIRAAARRALAKGAEVLIAPGPSCSLASSRGVFEIDGAPLLASFMLLVKAAEAMVGMHRLTGVAVSRRRLYRSPPKELLDEFARTRGLDQFLKKE